MGFINGPVLTEVGQELHARAMAGATLRFTTIKLGDGRLNTSNIAWTRELVHTVASVNINSVRYSGAYAIVSGAFSNREIGSGFYWREIGLFAENPDAPNDRSQDILYCYQNAGDMAEYIAASNSELITKRISIATIVNDVPDIQVLLNGRTTADDVSFDNTQTDLRSGTVQKAIEEVVRMIQGFDPFTEQEIADLLKGKADLDETGKVKPEQLPEISSAKSYSAVLSASGWTAGSDDRFYQSVSIAGVKADTPIVLVDVDLSASDLDTKVSYLEAWATVSTNEVVQGAGTLKFFAWEQPSVNIPISVGVM